VSGLGTGIALGGLLVETAGLPTAFVAGSGVVGAMAVLTLTISPRPTAARATAL
jgi:hypothetical protein